MCNLQLLKERNPDELNRIIAGVYSDEFLQKDVQAQFGKVSYTNISYLTVACKIGWVECVEALLAKKADANGITDMGPPQVSPYHAICLTTSVEEFEKICKLLSQYGADVNFFGTDNNSIVETIASSSKVKHKFDRVRILLERGLDPNNAFHSIWKYFQNDPQILHMAVYYDSYVPDIKALYKAALSNSNPKEDTSNSYEYVRNRMALCLGLPCQEDLIKQSKFKKKDEQLAFVNGFIKRYIKNRKLLMNDGLWLKENMNNNVYANPNTLLQNDMQMFNISSIIELEENDVKYGFHSYEIPSLLCYRKNPYTNREFSPELCETLVNLAYIPEYTEDSLVQVGQVPEITDHVLLQTIAKWLENWNTYMPIMNIVDLHPQYARSCVHLKDLLRKSSKTTLSIIQRLYYLITERKYTISQIAEELDVIIQDDLFCKEIKGIIGDDLFPFFLQSNYKAAFSFYPVKKNPVLTQEMFQSIYDIMAIRAKFWQWDVKELWSQACNYLPLYA